MTSTVHSIDASLVRARAKNVNSTKVSDSQIDAITTKWEYRTYNKLQKDPTTPFSAANDGAEVFNTVKSAIIDGAASEVMSQFANLQGESNSAYKQWKDATDELQFSDKETPVTGKRFDLNDGLNSDLYSTY